MLRVAGLLCASFMISSCNQGEVKDDKNLKESIARESMCVAESERFYLYSDASNHLEHAIKYAKDYARYKQADSRLFSYALPEARKYISGLSKEFGAQFLHEECDTQMTNEQFVRAS